jgi:hypothetical protein
MYLVSLIQIGEIRGIVCDSMLFELFHNYFLNFER